MHNVMRKDCKRDWRRCEEGQPWILNIIKLLRPCFVIFLLHAALTALKVLPIEHSWPFFIENHKNVSLSSQFVNAKRKSSRRWMGRDDEGDYEMVKNANQIIDELMWETHTKIIIIKINRCGREWSMRGGWEAVDPTTSKLFTFDKIIQGTFPYLRWFILARWDAILFHYADEIECIRKLRISSIPFTFGLIFSFLWHVINLCTEILFPMGAHFTPRV